MNRLRVLKLGWEFPPLINGGLGVACLGLSRALAKSFDLTVVVPRSGTDAGFNEFDLCCKVTEQAKLDIAAFTWDAATAKAFKIHEELVDSFP